MAKSLYISGEIQYLNFHPYLELKFMATYYSPWSLIPVLCFLSALSIFSIHFYLPSLPTIGKVLNVPEESVRLTLSMFFLGASIGNFFLGPVSDRMGRLIVAKGGILLFIFASFLCAHSQTLLALQIGLFFQGFACSAGSLIARSVGRDLYEGPYLTYFSATIMMIVSLSPGIAPTLGGVIECYFGWQKKFYFLMLFGVAIALLIWLRLPETLETSKRQAQKFAFFKNYSSFFQNSYCRVLCFIIGMQMSAIFCYVTLSPSLFISFFAWSPQEYGYVGISGALGNLIGFGFARHMSSRLHFHHGILIGTLSCFF
ncbi:MFS transporter [Candidatus Paracaedibacter symbiosus]|uniref:MFS transporter n=1 Tax=Candidatus Paracaedibacter symbiosus TaxID=244582 RepID=UPI0009FD23EB|nr:MFS transporter [Candidatus Paracaedibacter symbiosus]